jgi:hypothetical protein
MLISELPQPYKALAEKRREEEKSTYFYSKNSDSIIKAFNWSDTTEDNGFWHDCHYAQNESELPSFSYNFNEDITTNKMDDKELIKHLQFEIKLKNEAISHLLLDDEKGFSGIEEAIEIYKKHFFPYE